MGHSTGTGGSRWTMTEIALVVKVGTGESRPLRITLGVPPPSWRSSTAGAHSCSGHRDKGRGSSHPRQQESSGYLALDHCELQGPPCAAPWAEDLEMARETHRSGIESS